VWGARLVISGGKGRRLGILITINEKTVGVGGGISKKKKKKKGEGGK